MNGIMYPAIIEAIQSSAQHYGMEALAPRIGMSKGSLYNALNPWGDRQTAKLGLEQALAIMAVTGDVTGLTLMAQELHHIVRPIGCQEPDKPTWQEEAVDDTARHGRMQALMAAGATPEEVDAAKEAEKDDLDQTATKYRREWEAKEGQQ